MIVTSLTENVSDEGKGAILLNNKVGIDSPIPKRIRKDRAINAFKKGILIFVKEETNRPKLIVSKSIGMTKRV